MFYPWYSGCAHLNNLNRVLKFKHHLMAWVEPQIIEISFPFLLFESKLIRHIKYACVKVAQFSN